MKRRFRLGIDIGGTFTDLMLLDMETGSTCLWKTPSTPSDFSLGLTAGTERLLKLFSVSPDELGVLVHGTTVATNAILENRGARVGLLVTEGFADLMEMGTKYKNDIYDIRYRPAPPVVRRSLIGEVKERVASDGQISQHMDSDQVVQVCRHLIENGAESLAVCLLFSFLQPSHEETIKQIIKQHFPGTYICASVDILPEIREYERMMATALNAFVGPVVSRYLKGLESGLKSIGVSVPIRVMRSDGGNMPTEYTLEKPICTVLSGPAAGVVGAQAVASRAGFENIITFDMGGTSTDVSLVENGEPTLTSESTVAGYPIRLPSIDIVTIGAGGGSIAWLDQAGGLRVGPQSAGAVPGPACYGMGGDRPTVTDANVVLGYIDPAYFAGGEMTLRKDLAEEAMRKEVAEPLRMQLDEAAWGVLQVVNSNMVDSIRLVSVERGYDPRDFVLVPFGGAGPVHCVAVARELGIPKVLVPWSPGILSAYGLLVSDAKYDFVRTFLADLDQVDVGAVFDVLREFEQQGRTLLAREGSHVVAAARFFADVRYRGQSYNLRVELPSQGESPIEFKVAVRQAFEQVHEQRFGYLVKEAPLEIVNLRAYVGELEQEHRAPAFIRHSSPVTLGPREVYFKETGRITCPVMHRAALQEGSTLQGPCIVEQIDTTIVIPPGAKAYADSSCDLIVEVGRDE